jgi:hypothetical protein
MTTAETRRSKRSISWSRRPKPTRQARRPRCDVYRLINGTGAGCEVSPAQFSIASRGQRWGVVDYQTGIMDISDHLMQGAQTAGTASYGGC